MTRLAALMAMRSDKAGSTIEAFAMRMHARFACLWFGNARPHATLGDCACCFEFAAHSCCRPTVINSLSVHFAQNRAK
ncbi:hypothetical protein [Blastomonas aquatica]|uniref:hypothetical protein n=1 Tax=Blastomonas aquatica TaxID=1510276 RepID=UPI001E47A53E|nr:hypothetical protein [Blastomonas aquatica]